MEDKKLLHTQIQVKERTFQTMKAAQITQPMATTLTDVGEPSVGPADVKIQVKAAGICGTDVHILKGEYELARFPLTPGHEFSGEVVEVGSTVSRFRVGDRVTADPNIPCEFCVNCQRNRPNQCLNLHVIGVTRDGAFAEYVTAPEKVVYPIGDMPYEEAALIEPLACVVWGLERVQIQPGDRVLVLGAGPMGCLLGQSVRMSGASQVDITDVVSWRLSVAQSLGFDHCLLADDLDKMAPQLAPHGYDVVVDATGVPQVIQDMPKYAGARGKLWIFGVAPDDATVSFRPAEVFRKDLSIIGSFAVNRTFHGAINMIRSGRMQLAPIISHQLPLSDFEAGLDIAQNAEQRMKVQYSL